MPGLDGLPVLITRPAGQEKQLRRLLEDAGARVEWLPLTAIQPFDAEMVRRYLSTGLARCPRVIFVSRNAVRLAFKAAPELARWLAGKAVFAVGAGTRQALQEQGLEDIGFTASTRGAEALLELPDLAPPLVRGAGVAIVRGENGRELLAGELRKRGAEVVYINVYRRERPEIKPEKLTSVWHDLKPAIIVITSVSGLYNLIELTGAADRESLFRTRLVVMSDRIRQAALTAGFGPEPVVAATASDEGLAQAVMASALSRG